MGHIPPISEVFSGYFIILFLNFFKNFFLLKKEWTRRYITLVDRYTNIIKGIFYGHTHND